MILDPNKISQTIKGESLIFEYPLEFNGVQKTAQIQIIGAYPNRNVNVLLINAEGEEEQRHEFVSSEDQSEVKDSWEKFEDLFNQSDEGATQQPQDEVQNLFTSFDSSGNAVLFLENLNKEQQIVIVYELTELDLIKNQPLTYELNFENNQNIPEPLRAKWLMANVSGSVKCNEFPNYPFTYQVAILSIQPPQPPQHVDESDEMVFYRLVAIVGGNAILKEYTLNTKTNEEQFIQDTTMRLISQSEPYKVETPNGEGTLVPYSKLDNAEFKAYLIAIKTERPQPPQPVDESDEMVFYRMLNMSGTTAVLKQYVYDKNTDKETYVQDETFILLNDTPPFKTNTPEGEALLVRYSKFDADGLEAFLLILKGEGKDRKPIDVEIEDEDEENEEERERERKNDLENVVENENEYETDSFSKDVATYLGKDPLDIQRSMRSADSFRDLLAIYNVKVVDIATALNMPTDSKGFFAEVKKIIGR